MCSSYMELGHCAQNGNHVDKNCDTSRDFSLRVVHTSSHCWERVETTKGVRRCCITRPLGNLR